MKDSSSRRVAALAGVTILAAFAALFLMRRRVDAAPPAKPSSSAAQVARANTADQPVSEARREARRARDAMREDILAALKRRAAAAAPSAAPAHARPRPAAKAQEAPEEPRGHYEPSYIQAVVREDMFPLMRSCYEGALKRNPKVAGKLVLAFDIVGDPEVGGIVEGADFTEESTLKDEEMATCVRESLMTLTFDKPPSGGGRVSVKYPVEFAPGDDDEGDAGRAEKK
jgi:hypothetical protein